MQRFSVKAKNLSCVTVDVEFDQ